MAKKHSEPEETMVATVPEDDEPKRPRTLSKTVTKDEVRISVFGGNRGEMVFRAADYPPETQEQLPNFGLGHKLGDAAAGKKGADAEDAILKTDEALRRGEWTFRVPAQPKISLKDVASNLAKLSPEEQEAAKILFEKFGFKIPGVTG